MLQEYKSHLARIRAYLANSSQRDHNTLRECEQLIQQAKQCATAMLAMAEVEGNAVHVTEAKYLLERDITPLSKEIQRTIQTIQNQNNHSELISSSGGNRSAHGMYQAPNPHHNFDVEANFYRNNGSDMDALIQNSDDLLRESQSILNETEYIGNETIQQMYLQREQLTNAQQSLHNVRVVMATSGRILKSMSQRACRSRLFLYMLIGALISLDLFVLYCIYKKHTKHGTSDHPNSL